MTIPDRKKAAPPERGSRNASICRLVREEQHQEEQDRDDPGADLDFTDLAGEDTDEHIGDQGIIAIVRNEGRATDGSIQSRSLTQLIIRTPT